jgi:hypothetical protein
VTRRLLSTLAVVSLLAVSYSHADLTLVQPALAQQATSKPAGAAATATALVNEKD